MMTHVFSCKQLQAGSDIFDNKGAHYINFMSKYKGNFDQKKKIE